MEIWAMGRALPTARRSALIFLGWALTIAGERDAPGVEKTLKRIMPCRHGRMTMAHRHISIRSSPPSPLKSPPNRPMCPSNECPGHPAFQPSCEWSTLVDRPIELDLCPPTKHIATLGGLTL